MSNVAKVAIRWVMTHVFGIGEPSQSWDAICTFHVMKPASDPAISEEDREDINLAVIRWWMADNGGFTEVRSFYPTAVVLESVTSWTIQPSVSEPTITELVEDNAGTDSDRVVECPQLCFGIGLRTLVDTRRGRGRMYLPASRNFLVNAFHAGFVDEGLQIDLGHIAAHLAYEVRAIQAVGVDDGPFVLCVYSRAAGDPTPVTRFEIPDRILTQRRRAIRPLTHLLCGLSDGEPA